MVGSWTDRAEHLREELRRLAGLVQRFRLPHSAGAASITHAEIETDKRLAAPGDPEFRLAAGSARIQ